MRNLIKNVTTCIFMNRSTKNNSEFINFKFEDINNHYSINFTEKNEVELCCIETTILSTFIKVNYLYRYFLNLTLECIITMSNYLY